MQWIMRERPKIDRIACPWLVTRFIDSTPEFLFVAADQVLVIARTTGAIPYDIPGAVLSHEDGFKFDLWSVYEHVDLAASPCLHDGAAGRDLGLRRGARYHPAAAADPDHRRAARRRYHADGLRKPRPGAALAVHRAPGRQRGDRVRHAGTEGGGADRRHQPRAWRAGGSGARPRLRHRHRHRPTGRHRREHAEGGSARAGRGLSGRHGVCARGAQTLCFGRSGRYRHRDRRAHEHACSDHSARWPSRQQPVRPRVRAHLRQRADAPAAGRDRSGGRSGDRPYRSARRRGQPRSADHACAAAGFHRLRGQRQAAGVEPRQPPRGRHVRGGRRSRRAGHRPPAWLGVRRGRSRHGFRFQNTGRYGDQDRRRHARSECACSGCRSHVAPSLFPAQESARENSTTHHGCSAQYRRHFDVNADIAEVAVTKRPLAAARFKPKSEHAACAPCRSNLAEIRH
ncbi:MAG: hypothetical protein EPN58_01705 [Rhodanobacter sp.]|nr:MAG: hypothetical protein EPN58_01705 [Rhodanobacter sp.]